MQEILCEDLHTTTATRNSFAGQFIYITLIVILFLFFFFRTQYNNSLAWFKFGANVTEKKLNLFESNKSYWITVFRLTCESWTRNIIFNLFVCCFGLVGFRPLPTASPHSWSSDGQKSEDLWGARLKDNGGFLSPNFHAMCC